jgi:hypothetical protein
VKRTDNRLVPTARDVETIARAIALAERLDLLGVAGANDVKVWWLELQDAITPNVRSE